MSGSTANPVGWYPHDPTFRREFEKRLYAALDHLRQHGDVGQIAKLVDAIPESQSRRSILHRMVIALPIELGKSHGQLKVDRARFGRFDWDNPPRLQIFDKADKTRSDLIMWNGEHLTSDEFVDEVIDVLVLKRALFLVGGLRRLIDATNAIMQRLESDHTT